MSGAPGQTPFHSSLPGLSPGGINTMFPGAAGGMPGVSAPGSGVLPILSPTTLHLQKVLMVIGRRLLDAQALYNADPSSPVLLDHFVAVRKTTDNALVDAGVNFFEESRLREAKLEKELEEAEAVRLGLGEGSGMNGGSGLGGGDPM